MKMRYFNNARALYIAVGILFLTVAIGFYLDMKNDTMFASHLEISIGLEKIARLDQELSSMLLLSVVEWMLRMPMWTDRSVLPCWQ